MEWPLILLNFIFLAIVVALAWFGKRRTSIVLFCLLLILMAFTLWHHMTDALPIQL